MGSIREKLALLAVFAMGCTRSMGPAAESREPRATAADAAAASVAADAAIPSASPSQPAAMSPPDSGPPAAAGTAAPPAAATPAADGGPTSPPAAARDEDAGPAVAGAEHALDCASFGTPSPPFGFESASCSNLRRWIPPRPSRDGYLATESDAWVILGGADGFAGAARLRLQSGDDEPSSLFWFDAAGKCVQRLGEVPARGPMNFHAARALVRDGVSAVLGHCAYKGSCGAFLVTDRQAVELSPPANPSGASHWIALAAGARILVLSYLSAAADQRLELRVFDAHGLLLRQVQRDSPGVPRAIETTNEDQLLVLFDEGSTGARRSRIDRFDLELVALDTWRAPNGVTVDALSTNASGQLAVAGASAGRSWVQVLGLADWSTRWPAAVGGELGTGAAVHLTDAGSVAVFGGQQSSNTLWIARYTPAGLSAAPTRSFVDNGQPTTALVSAGAAVRYQSDGTAIASSGYQLYGACD
jgi:hypothetical protein